jgi:hypothetical protein
MLRLAAMLAPVARGAGRDPLSPRFDAAAGRFVSRAIAANGRPVRTAVARPSDRAVGQLLGRGIDPLLIRYTGRASGLETAYEAAFRRAVYWDVRVYLWARPTRYDDDGRVRNPERRVAVQFRWGRRSVAGRECEVRVWPVAAASRWADRNRPYRD